MVDHTYHEIRESEKYLSFETEDVLSTLEAMAGTQSVTREEDLAGNGNTMDASEAASAKELQSNPALMGLIERWKARRDSYKEKAEATTWGTGKGKRALTGEERLTFLNKSVELTAVLTDIGNLFADAAEYKPTTSEKMLGAKKTTSLPSHAVSDFLGPDFTDKPTATRKLTAQEEADENTKRIALLMRNTERTIKGFDTEPNGKLVD